MSSSCIRRMSARRSGGLSGVHRRRTQSCARPAFSTCRWSRDGPEGGADADASRSICRRTSASDSGLPSSAVVPCTARTRFNWWSCSFQSGGSTRLSAAALDASMRIRTEVRRSSRSRYRPGTWGLTAGTPRVEAGDVRRSSPNCMCLAAAARTARVQPSVGALVAAHPRVSVARPHVSYVYLVVRPGSGAGLRLVGTRPATAHGHRTPGAPEPCFGGCQVVLRWCVRPASCSTTHRCRPRPSPSGSRSPCPARLVRAGGLRRRGLGRW